MKYGVVYKITNKVNGKLYIGLTTVGIFKRFAQHCSAYSVIGSAIRKYGVENFEIEEVAKLRDDIARKQHGVRTPCL